MAPTPVATPSVAPTATPSTTPFIDGATLTFARTATATGETSLTGITCTSPEDAVTETTPATINATVAIGQTFAGLTNLASVTTVTSLHGCDDGPEATTETDYFATTAAASGKAASVTLVGSKIAYPAFHDLIPQDLVTITYGTSGRIVDESPSETGRTWTNPATATTTTTYSSQSYTVSDVRTVAADGSYADTANSNAPDGTFSFDTSTTIENSDASGSQSETGGPDPTAPPFIESLSAPKNGTVIVSTTGSRYQPPEPTPTPTACFTGATPCPTAAPATPYPQHAWYPYVPSATKPFETISSIDKGPSMVPSGCAVASSFATTADLIETVDSTLDIWFGTSTITSDAYIDPNAGLLCLHLTSTRNGYNFGPTSADETPVVTYGLDETVSLKAESVPSSALRRAAVSGIVPIPSLTRLAAFAIARAAEPLGPLRRMQARHEP